MQGICDQHAPFPGKESEVIFPVLPSDLPVKYEQDRISLLVRDPHWLYVYWEISELRKDLLIKELGSEFISRSVPVLRITNVSNNESFFVRINEFSTNWYVNVADANSVYIAELGRKISDSFFVSLLSSNSVVTPGDSVSSSSAAYFVNYTHVREGILDMGMIKKFDRPPHSESLAEYFGISSLELTGHSESKSFLGESSAQFYGL